MNPVGAVRRTARNLPLFWKVLVPFVVLVVLVGALGAFLVVRNLADRAQADLDRVLAERSLAARSALLDQELYLVEAVGFAANLEGMDGAVNRRDLRTIEQLLESVLALKSSVTLVAVTDKQGSGLVEFTRAAPEASPTLAKPAAWADLPVVARVLAAPGELTLGSLTRSGDETRLTLATTICAGKQTCAPIGAVVVSFELNRLLRLAVTNSVSKTDAFQGGAAIYTDDGRLAATSGAIAQHAPLPEAARQGFVRRTERVEGEETTALYSPFTVQGERAGILAVSLPRGPAFASARGAGWQLGIVLFVALIGITAIGAGLSRSILGQVRSLLETNKAIGAGDLSARTPVLGRDELGELADGVNRMAAQLQESYEDLEAKVEDRTAAVQRLLRERTDFFTAVSHEFRTPLAVILGQARMLGDPRVPKRAGWNDQAASMIAESGNQLLGFVNDILEIAKAESGRIEIEPAKLRIPALVDSLHPSMQSLAAQAGLALSVHIPRRLPAVWADEARVRQVLINLVDNAVKYTPRGGNVEISARSADEFVSVSVTDTGVGIPLDAQPHLFDPFYRVKGVQPQGGQPSSGLGLALVDRLVRAQRGSVAVESNPGEGTTFTFTLPLASATKPPAESDAETAAIPG